jgi:hypothetical protein
MQIPPCHSLAGGIPLGISCIFQKKTNSLIRAICFLRVCALLPQMHENFPKGEYIRPLGISQLSSCGWFALCNQQSQVELFLLIVVKSFYKERNNNPLYIVYNTQVCRIV